MRSKFEVMRENRRRRERKPSQMYWLGGCVGGTGGSGLVKTLSGLYGNAYNEGLGLPPTGLSLHNASVGFYEAGGLGQQLGNLGGLGLFQNQLNPAEFAAHGKRNLSSAEEPNVYVQALPDGKGGVAGSAVRHLAVRLRQLGQQIAKLLRRKAG